MLKMKSIKLWEEHPNHDCLDYDKMSLHDLDLLIGPNASGKSQFFARLKHLNHLHRKDLQNPSTWDTTFCANIIFQEEGQEEITYTLTARPDNLIDEVIKSDSKDYFISDGKKVKIWNEKDKTEIKQHFYDKSKTITTQEQMPNIQSFPTISKIGNFLQSIYFLDTDKFNPYNMTFGPQHLVPDHQLSNLYACIVNWKEQYPKLYKLLLTQYQDFFPSVTGFSHEKCNNNTNDMLKIKEENMNSPIWASNMSCGMIRILGILTLSMSRQLAAELEWNPPSMIAIDEIDNGLDYKYIGDIINHIEAEASFSQILFSSHSPVVCNFVDPEKWHVFKRLGGKVKITTPPEISTTRKLIEKARMSNWELFKDHIYHSSLYAVK